MKTMRYGFMTIALAPLFFLAVFSSSPASAESIDMRPYYVDVNLYFGFEKLDSGDWKPVDQMSKVGISADYAPYDFPGIITAAVYRASGSGEKDGFSIDVEHWEGHLGLKKPFLIEAYPEVAPYIAGGLAAVRYTSDIEDTGDVSGTGAGLWAGGGVSVLLGEKFNAGLDLRYSFVPVDNGENNINGGGAFAGFFVGYRWNNEF